MTSDEQIEATVCQLISRVLPQLNRPKVVTREMKLREQLGMDSVALFSAVFSLEQRMNIDLSESIEALTSAVYVGDLVDTVAAVLRGSAS